jgi:hypothetical protein
MSGKSVCKKLLVEHCDAIHAAAGTRMRVEYPCDDAAPPLVRCCDGMVLLNRIGNVLSQPTPVGEYTEDGARAYNIEDLDMASAFTSDSALEGFYEEDAVQEERRPYGTWRQLTNAIAREVTSMLKSPATRVVVLGFDKKKFVDGVKRLTHAKRRDRRAEDRAKQIAKDEAAGLTPTRGIPFKYEDIVDSALVPYPWKEVLHGHGQASAIIRYITTRLLRFFKPPHPGQALIVDGHELALADATAARLGECMLDRTPISIAAGVREVAPWFENAIGEFDHTAFFYVRRLTTDADVQARYGLNPDTAPRARVHIRTNDTDTIMMGLVFLERLAVTAPQTAGMELAMEIPHRAPVKHDMCIDVQRMLTTLTRKHGTAVRYPGSYFAYGLYLKENDYDVPFMKGVGHVAFMRALVHYPHAIGDLVQPPTPLTPTVHCESARKVRLMEDAACSSNAVAIDLTVDSPTPGLYSSDDEQTTGRKRKRSPEEDAPTSGGAFQVDPWSVVRLAAACYYEVVHYRTAAQHAAREEKVRTGKFKELDRELLSHEFITNVCKKRKASAITPAELDAKARRHGYYVAITEDLMLGHPRSIPFEVAHEHGYDPAKYKTTFQ